MWRLPWSNGFPQGELEFVKNIDSGRYVGLAALVPFPGDTDDDWDVDDADLNNLLTNFGQGGLLGGRHDGDYDLNIVVDDADLNRLLTHFATKASTASAFAAVPEPGSLVVVLLGVLGAAGVRRRRCS